MEVLLTDLQLNFRMLIFKINYTLWLLFYIKTIFHAKLFWLLFYIYACLLGYYYKLFIIFANVLHKE